MISTMKIHPNKKSLLKKTAAILLALAVWQTVAMLIDSELILVTPTEVLKRLLTVWREPTFFASLFFTSSKIILGFLTAFAVGIGLGALAGRFGIIETLLWPWMLTIKSVPIASFVLIILLFVSSADISVFISFLIVLPIIYTNVLTAIKSTDEKLLEAARLFRTPAKYRLLYIRLPQIKPYLISASSVGCGLAFKAGVAAELIGIPTGSIGEALYNAKIYLNSADLFAWTVIIILISVLCEKLFIFLLRLAFAGMEKL